ncbi:MAG: substrate-binding domain-containing protein [Treponema sp.]|jgi:ribose transport system substrate-binding protein|nr:substrate-binding domain-containing protein [Treponema sp.]
MKKGLLVVLCVLFVASFVFAGGGQQSSGGSAPAASSAPVVLPSGAVMSTGPHGEQASPASDLSLTADELAKIKAGKYKAAICFHYNGDDWSAAQEKGLRDQFGRMGIEVVAVTSANFNAAQQKADIETVLALNPDAIVSIPVDVVSAESVFKDAAKKGVKIVFMDNCPDNMIAGTDYVSVVSADNYGNGVAAAEIMGEKLGGKGKIAMVYYDANFFVTNQRDEAFRKTIREKFPGITIVEEAGFNDVNKGAEVGGALITKHPDLNGIYATWDIPAEGVVSALRANGRNDIIVTTIDLGNNVARILAQDGIVKGLGAQRPYDQGVAEAILVGYALVGKKAPGYVALPPYKVTHENVLEAYKGIYYVDAPVDIRNAYKK